MRRAALLVAALGLALVAPAAAGERSPTASELEAELVCPTCDTTLDQSDSPIARRMKQYLRERIAAGDTKSEIKASLVEQFGPGVLAEPRKSGFDLLAWLLPIGGMLAGAVIVGALAWRWSRSRGGPGEPPEAPLDPELERRLDAELDRYE